MKNLYKYFVIVILLFWATIYFSSCEKNQSLPVVTTTDISGITYTAASTGGYVTNIGNSEVTSRGICWNTSENPTTANSKTVDGTGTGFFSSSLSQLIPGTKYYAKAYAINSAGTAYGNQVSFTTNQLVVVTLTTSEVTKISVAGAKSGGTIINVAGIITDAGVCWGTTSNPTTSNNKTGLNYYINEISYESYLTGLQPSTKYYIRAYATNGAGTAYGNELSFTTSAINPIIFNPDLTYGSVSDIDGNNYKTIQIGTQFWMAENLKTTKYNDGTSIPNVTNNIVWGNLTAGGYSWYDNNASSFKTTYGALYNWYAVTDSRKICPTGWHVPTSGEWNTLATILGGETVAGGKVKEIGTTHWERPNTGATNEAGFTGLPGGVRSYNYELEAYNKFGSLGDVGVWWSATGGLSADYFGIDFSSAWGLSNESQTYKRDGLSVRCIKDN